MLDVEPLIVGELNRVAALDTFDGFDWDDVLARADIHSPRRTWLRTALLAAVVFAVAAPALAFRNHVIDFFTAPHAPRPAVVEFGRMQVAASFPAVAPGVLPHQARLITPGTTDAGPGRLSVAPTRFGGFCDFWSTSAPECLPRRSQARQPDMLGTFAYDSEAAGLGVSWIEGSILDKSATVTLHYAGGKTTTIPYVWVTAPIRAGFFYYRIPGGHDSPRTRPVALTVKVNGRPQIRERIGATSLATDTVEQTDRYGQTIQVPAEAAWSKRKLLASFNEKNGILVEFWVMPSRHGGSRRCFVANPFASGCGPTTLSGDPLQLAIVPGATVMLFGEVAANVASIRLRFENGDVQQTKPTNGFLLTRIKPRNYPPYRRLIAADALGTNGYTLFVENFNTTQRATYPCAHPKNYGYGVTECP